jgi:heparin binding hemagglutinin HbhA
VIDMASMPTAQDVRKASEQARSALATAIDQARTPFYAAVGAGELATKALIDAVEKARTQVTERADAARTAVDDLPTDVAGLRSKLDPAELRKLVEQYTEVALKLYQHLSEEGEKTVDRLRSQPQVKRAVEQFDQAAQAAQHRAETAVEDARELADDVLGRVIRRTRSTGEKAATVVESVSEEAAEEVVEAGAEAAHEVRSTTRKAANRTGTVRKQATGTTAKPRTTGGK